jgi:hypothetical protein
VCLPYVFSAELGPGHVDELAAAFTAGIEELAVL